MYAARKFPILGLALLASVSVFAPSARVQEPASQRSFVDNIFRPTDPAAFKHPVTATPSASSSPLTPNDPGYDAPWGSVLDIPSLLGELQQRIQAGTLNAQTVYVVILDGHVMSHPDLDPLRATQYDRDFVGTPFDPTLGSHGTGVASIAVARTHNAMGASSVGGFTGSVKFISVRIFDTDGTATLQREADALNYIASLVTQGVPVVAVACAFGGPDASALERDSINALTSKGVVVFAGAGPKNGGGFYPASYSDTNSMVVPVSSLSADGNGLSSQDWGGRAIAAPTNVQVVVQQSQPDRTSTFGGVSASTGQPAAAYALIRSLFPSLSPLGALRRLGFSTLPLNGTTEGKLNPNLAATNRVFLVGSPLGSTKAVALDALVHAAEPLVVRTRYFTTSYSVNEPTKVMLLAYNLDPTTPLASVSVRTTDLNDANGKTLIVDSIAAFPDMPFLATVTVLLRDDLAGAGDVRIRLTANGVETDPVVLRIK